MLHKETVEPRTFQIIVDLQQKEYLKSFYLVGGTALSLQLGHRISDDIDLFTPNALTKMNYYRFCKMILILSPKKNSGIHCLGISAR